MAVICARVESDRRCGAAGWLHRLRVDETWQPTMRSVQIPLLPSNNAVAVDFDRLVERCSAAMNPAALGRLASDLGLSVRSLSRLSVGWSTKHGAWSFPMRHPGGDVLGIRLRFPSGRKTAVTGGRDGLFLPRDLQVSQRLLIAEGPTDTAALLDLGFAAVGRPSCSGGVQLLVDLVKRTPGAEVVIMADGDGPGRNGGESLAAALLAYSATVRVITPPDEFNDVRQWRQGGASFDHVLQLIEATTPQLLKINVRGVSR